MLVRQMAVPKLQASFGRKPHGSEYSAGLSLPVLRG
jgi:hypothetical protein